MRLQFPRRIPLSRAFFFAVLLFCVQQFQHTGRAFSVLCFAFLLLSAIAFNLAHGFSTVIGSYVFWFSLLTVDIGIVWKAILREPADTNLAAPLLCISAYTVSMAVLLGVVLINRRFDLRGLSVAARLGTRHMDYEVAATGCLVAGIGIPLLGNFLPGGNGSLLSILIQINVFPTVAILLGTIAAIRSSGGRRSVNLVSGLAMAFVFLFGALNYSKQGMLTPFVCWLVPCFYMRYRVNIFHGLVMAAFAVFAFTVVPVWANARVDQPPDGANLPQQIRLAIFEIRHYDDLKERTAELTSPEFGVHVYYNTPQGLFDRLNILGADDPLFDYSETHPYFGYSPIYADFYNWIPHVILADKPTLITGNTYAHEIGGLAPDDFTTGISFSPVAEAYHIDGWRGILVLLPLIWIMLFQTIDFVAGDLRYSPWGLFLVVYFAHAAAESLLGGLIYYSFNGNLGMAIAIFFCMRIAPVLGSLLPSRSPANPAPSGTSNRVAHPTAL